MSLLLKSSFFTETNKQTKKQENISQLNKKLNLLESRIKIEEKNRLFRNDTFFLEKNKLETMLNSIKDEIGLTLNTLNVKENLVYEVQKDKFSEFSNEIQSFESVAGELEKRLFSTENSILLKKKVFNQKKLSIGMQEADYESYICELNIQEKEKEKLMGRIGAIERTYPKEFEYLYQDLVLKKELQEVINQRNVLKRKLLFIEKDMKVEDKEIERLELELDKRNKILNENKQKLEEAMHDVYFSTIEQYIESSVSDVFNFDKLKLLTQKYYRPKKFNVEVELNKSLIINLSLKQAELRKEASELKKIHVEKRLDYIKTLQDLYDASHVYCKDRTKLKEEIMKNEDMIKSISFNLKLLEQNFRKKDVLFTKYIQSLQETVDNSTKDEESYYKLNPALITEKEFETKLEEELLKVIKDKFVGEELFEKENIVKQYFKELEKREVSIQTLKFEETRICKEIEVIESSLIRKIEENKKMKKEVLLMESQLNDILYNREIIINTRVESRNNGLSKHLLIYTPDEFEKYLSVNKNLYKQVLRKFSSFNYRSLSSSDREIFFELVIDDHSIKKNKYFDLIGQSISDQAVIDNWEETKEKIYKEYIKSYENYESSKKEIDSLQLEIDLLSSSKVSLKEKIEMTLKKQINEIEIEKKDLQVKYKVNFYKYKAKELSEKHEEMQKKIDTLVKENDEITTKSQCDMEILLGEYEKIKEELIKIDPSVNVNFDVRSNVHLNQVKNVESNENNEIQKCSFTERSKSIDFIKTLDEVNQEYKSTYQRKVTAALDDIIVFDSNAPEEVKNEEVGFNNDSQLNISLEKIQMLINGIQIYKKLSISNKYFDMLNSDILPPEKSGFGKRTLILNLNSEQLEIRKGKHIENSVHISKLKGMILSNITKELIKYYVSGKTPSTFAVPEADKLIKCKYIPLQLTLNEGSIEIISQNYEEYKILIEAYEELIQIKKNYRSIFKALLSKA